MDGLFSNSRTSGTSSSQPSRSGPQVVSGTEGAIQLSAPHLNQPELPETPFNGRRDPLFAVPSIPESGQRLVDPVEDRPGVAYSVTRNSTLNDSGVYLEPTRLELLRNAAAPLSPNYDPFVTLPATGRGGHASYSSYIPAERTGIPPAPTTSYYDPLAVPASRNPLNSSGSYHNTFEPGSIGAATAPGSQDYNSFVSSFTNSRENNGSHPAYSTAERTGFYSLPAIPTSNSTGNGSGRYPNYFESGLTGSAAAPTTDHQGPSVIRKVNRIMNAGAPLSHHTESGVTGSLPGLPHLSTSSSFVPGNLSANGLNGTGVLTAQMNSQAHEGASATAAEVRMAADKEAQLPYSGARVSLSVPSTLSRSLSGVPATVLPAVAPVVARHNTGPSAHAIPRSSATLHPYHTYDYNVAPQVLGPQSNTLIPSRIPYKLAPYVETGNGASGREGDVFSQATSSVLDSDPAAVVSTTKRDRSSSGEGLEESPRKKGRNGQPRTSVRGSSLTPIVWTNNGDEDQEAGGSEAQDESENLTQAEMVGQYIFSRSMRVLDRVLEEEKNGSSR
ncbi:hypothetical protein FRB90_005677, partial [Tulasnella sp. 427]